MVSKERQLFGDGTMVKAHAQGPNPIGNVAAERVEERHFIAAEGIRVGRINRQHTVVAAAAVSAAGVCRGPMIGQPAVVAVAADERNIDGAPRGALHCAFRHQFGGSFRTDGWDLGSSFGSRLWTSADLVRIRRIAFGSLDAAEHVVRVGIANRRNMVTAVSHNELADRAQEPALVVGMDEQLIAFGNEPQRAIEPLLLELGTFAFGNVAPVGHDPDPVSYTHLTLPTKR